MTNLKILKTTISLVAMFAALLSASDSFAYSNECATVYIEVMEETHRVCYNADGVPIYFGDSEDDISFDVDTGIEYDESGRVSSAITIYTFYDSNGDYIYDTSDSYYFDGTHGSKTIYSLDDQGNVVDSRIEYEVNDDGNIVATSRDYGLSINMTYDGETGDPYTGAGKIRGYEELRNFDRMIFTKNYNGDGSYDFTIYAENGDFDHVISYNPDLNQGFIMYRDRKITYDGDPLNGGVVSSAEIRVNDDKIVTYDGDPENGGVILSTRIRVDGVWQTYYPEDEEGDGEDGEGEDEPENLAREVTDQNGNVIARYDENGTMRYAKGEDGSSYVFDAEGNLTGMTKRGPFTIPEANALTKDGPVNTVTITW